MESNPVETNRQAIEREVFNKLVQEKWGKKSLAVDRSQPPFADYSGDLFEGAVRFMGDLKGKRVLEIGCGSGEIVVWMALQGAQVTGIDVSDESIVIAQKRAVENNVADKTNFLACPAENMPFENAIFDIVFINVSLHHLELELALAECKRVLKNSGHFIAVEPLTFSRVIQKIRTSRFVTRFYPIRQETPTERILTADDVAYIKTVFSETQIVPFRIFSPFIFKAKPLFNLLSKAFKGESWEEQKQHCNRYFQRLDEALISTIPQLRYLSRYVVISCVKNER